MKKISIAQHFSDVPIARYRWQSDVSGESFRVDFLSPALKAEEYVQVDLDGVEGYGSSFLEEAFGGLIREGFSIDFLNKHLSLKSEDDPAYVTEVEKYIKQAHERRK